MLGSTLCDPPRRLMQHLAAPLRPASAANCLQLNLTRGADFMLSAAVTSPGLRNATRFAFSTARRNVPRPTKSKAMRCHYEHFNRIDTTTEIDFFFFSFLTEIAHKVNIKCRFTGDLRFFFITRGIHITKDIDFVLLAAFTSQKTLRLYH